MKPHLFFFACATLFCAGRAIAAPGDRDDTFGPGGVAMVDLSAQQLDLVPGPSALTAGGKIVVASQVRAGTGIAKPGDILMTRFLATGQLDDTFGTGGLAWFDADGSTLDEPAAVVPLAGDKLLVAVRGGGMLSIVRLLAGGSLDTSFSGDGKLPTSLAATGGSQCLAVQADGKILAVGSRYNLGAITMAIRRFSPDGEVDSSFGQNGQVFPLVSCQGEAIVAIPDGRIVVAGSANPNPNGAGLLQSGQVIPSVPEQSEGIQPVLDGRIELPGIPYPAFVVAVRLTSGGMVDPDFGISGVASRSVTANGALLTGPSLQTAQVRVADDGAVTIWSRADRSLYQTAFLANGTVDEGGSKVTKLYNATATGMTLDETGRPLWYGQNGTVSSGGTSGSMGTLILTGGLTPTSAHVAMLQRFNTNFTTDASYGFAGRASVRSTSPQARAVSAIALPGGATIFVMSDPAGGFGRLAVCRLIQGEPKPVILVQQGGRISPEPGSTQPPVTGGILNLIQPSTIPGGLSPAEKGLTSGVPFDLGAVTPDRPTVWKFLVRNGGSAPLTNLTATVTAGAPDYSVSALPSSLAPGEEANVVVTVNPTRTGQLNGSIRIMGGEAADVSFDLALQATGQETTISFVHPETLVNESDGRVLLPLRLGRALNHEIRVTATTVPLQRGPVIIVSLLGNTTVTATPDTDFTGPSASAVFPPGTTEANLALNLIMDALPEGSEFNYIRLSPPSELAIGTYGYTKLSITDDSFSGFETGEIQVSEQEGTVRIPLRLNRSHDWDISLQIGVDYSRSSATGYDVDLPGSFWLGRPPSLEPYMPFAEEKVLVRIPRGSLVGFVTVTILPDTVSDDDESLFLTLDDGTPNASGQNTSIRIRIRENGSLGLPSFPAAPRSQIVAKGSRAALSAIVSGAVPLTFRWSKDDQPFANQTGAEVTLPSAALSDAGVYRLIATNSFGSATSESVALAVVDTAPGASVVLTAGSEARFTAAAEGPNLGFQWRKDGQPLNPADARLEGSTTKTLIVRQTSAPDSGVYTCRVTSPAGYLETGPQPLFVVSGVPVLLPLTFADQMATLPISVQVGFDPAPALRPSRFQITGLPSGVGYNPATGLISGTAKTAGEFPVTVTASNPAGTSAPVSATLRVRPFDEKLVGTWVALVKPSTENTSFYQVGDFGGRIDFVVGGTGAVSGTLRRGSEVYRWRGTVVPNLNDEAVTLAVSLPRPGSSPLSLEISLSENLADGSLANPNYVRPITLGQPSPPFTQNVTGWRKVWISRWSTRGSASAATDRLAWAYAGYHTFILPDEEPVTPPPASRAKAASKSSSTSLISIGDNSFVNTTTYTLPGNQGPTKHGIGFGSVFVTPDGNVVFTGKTGFRQPFTCSAPLGPEGQLALFVPFAGGDGVLWGIANMASDAPHSIACRAGDRFYWIPRRNSGLSVSTDLKMDLQIQGAKYTPPASLQALLPEEAAGQGVAEFRGFGFGTEDQPTTLSFTLNGNAVALPSPALPGLVDLKINRATGFFSGRVRREEPGPNPATPVRRTRTFSGVFTEGRGAGIVDVDGLNYGPVEITGRVE